MTKPWLKFYDPWVPPSIDYPKIPIDRFLSDAASKHPTHTALIFGAMVGSRLMDTKISYGELNQKVDRFAAGLQKLGVKKGDRVAIMLPNCPQFVIAAYAVWRIGGIVVCCNPLYVPRELEHLTNDSGAETFIVMSSLYTRVKGVRPKTPIKRVIVTNIKEYFPFVLKTLFTLAKEKKEGHHVDISADADTYWFQDVLNSASDKPVAVDISPDDVSTLIYTGGTTGVPKGVQLTHFNLVSNATALNIWAQSREAGEVMLGVMPYFHSYGLTVGINVVIANCNTVVQIPNPRDMVHVLTSIQKHRVTYYPGVPTMFIGFLNFPKRQDYTLSSLRFAVSAAAPLPPEIQDRFQEVTGGVMMEAYGLTETSPCVTMDPVGRPKPYSIGIPISDTEVKIVDIESGTKEMPIGETGEIIIKGPQVMKGYWNMPSETANVIRNAPDGTPGWFFSGDIGYMDEEGYIHISDRKKDLIIVGGYNVYPAEVEAVLYEHPAIKEAAVIGVPDARRGEAVKAFVVLKEGQQATAEEIIEFCRGQLAAYKVPRSIEFRQELPKSMIGKVLRRELREATSQ